MLEGDLHATIESISVCLITPITSIVSEIASYPSSHEQGHCNSAPAHLVRAPVQQLMTGSQQISEKAALEHTE